MVRSPYPVGYRFQPTDVELVMYYLKRKVLGKRFHSNVDVISTVDIYKYEPWDIPEKSCLQNGDLKWYFFCPRDRKYGTGQRMNRATERGYWKTTGKDRAVNYNDRVVGKIRTLVFHMGRPPHGDRMDWIIHEYRLQENDLTERGVIQDAYVLCEIYEKDGPGPRNGAQYGAPFIEEEWTDDEENRVGLDPFAVPSIPPYVLPSDPNKAVASTSDASKMLCMESFSNQHPSKILTSIDVALLPPPVIYFFTNGPTSQTPQIPDYEVLPMLAPLIGEDDVVSNEDNIQNVNFLTFEGNTEVHCPEETGIYNHSAGLNVMDQLDIWRVDHAPNQMFLSHDQLDFLDLGDLLDVSDEDVNSETSDGISEVLCPEETGIYHHFPGLDFSDENVNSETFDGISEVLCSEETGIYRHLPDLDNMAQLNNFGDIFGGWRDDHAPDQVFSSDDQLSFLELIDLERPLEFPDELIGWARQDGFYAEPQFFPNDQQFNDSADSSSVILNLPAPSESSVLQLVGPSGFQDPIFLEEGDGLREIPREEHENSEATSTNLGEVLSDESEPGDECTQQSSRRGKLITTSRLQSLLESMRSYPESAMELAPLKEKRIEGDVLLYGGSSIYVKAEVTHRAGGSTKDALSKILEESPLTLYYESSYSSSWSDLFAFILDIYFCFVWFLICGVVTNLSDCRLDLHFDFLCYMFSVEYTSLKFYCFCF